MKRILVVIIALFIMAGSMNLQEYSAVNAAEVTTAPENDQETVFYKGVANRKVNVRLGPGTKYDKLVVNDKNVQLSSGDEVIIIGEATASDGNTWYEIRFELDGQTVEGFSTSSYVAKTDDIITPTPLPTPTPTITPTPAPTSTIVPTEPLVPTQAVVPEVNQDKEKDIKQYIIIVSAAFGVFIVLIIILKLVRRRHKKANSDMSVKVDKIKKVKINEEDKNSNRKRKPEVKKLAEDTPVVESRKQEIYLAGNIEPDDSPYNEEYSMVDADDIKENASREAEEKKALRAEIERLQEHDIVVHKYFGEGEVYDNSDVNLLEVRFENDVRFLNKDALVSKHLLEVFDDDQQIIKRRNNTGKKGGKKSSMNKKE